MLSKNINILTPSCDLCGKHHIIKDCILLENNKKQSVDWFELLMLQLGNYHVDVELSQPHKPNLSLASLTLPNWICMENKKKMLVLREIGKGTKFGPVLGSISSNPKKNALFPLCIQLSDHILWIDQTNESNSSWLSLIPVSPQNYSLVACQIDENIYFVAVKDIKISEELCVWYAPFYKNKLPKNVLEKALCDHNIPGFVNKDEDLTDKSESEIISVPVPCKNYLQTANLMTLNEFPLLENIYITNSGVATSLGDSSLIQTFANKLINPLIISSNSVITNTLRIGGSNSSVIFFPTSFPSFNLDSSESCASSKAEFNPMPSITSSTEQDREPLVSEGSIEGNGRLENSKANPKELGLLEPNIKNLQNITINNSELTFTYKFKKSAFTNSDNKKTQISSKINMKNRIHESRAKIVIRTGLSENRDTKLNANSWNNSSIQISGEEKLNDTPFEFDIITLNVSEDKLDSYSTPLSRVVKKSRLECKTSLPETKSKEYTLSTNSSVGGFSSQSFVCNQCGVTKFPSKLSFIFHLRDHLTSILKRKFICQLCGLSFKTVDQLKKHSKTHVSCYSDGLVQGSELISHTKNERSWKGQFFCQICLKKFPSAKFLIKHFSKHIGEFFCSLCKKEFTRKENFKTHLCVQRTENPWKCQLCKKRFTNERSFELHSLEHDEKLKCSSCSQIFLTENNVKLHQNKCRKEISSTETLRFSCHICSRSFSSMVFLEDHVVFCQQLEDVNKNGEVNCNECGTLCRNPVELRIHLQKHTCPYLCLHCSQRFRSRGTYDRHFCGLEFPCEMCGAIHRSLQELFKHVTIHVPPPSCCLRCRSPFYRMDSVKLHQCKLEVNEKMDQVTKKKIPCYFCPALFVSEHNLKKHMASLHNIPLKQKFICGKCGKNFHRSDLLKNHELVHSEPSFKCFECPKKFRSRTSFALHSAFHKGDFRYSCKLCNKGFTQKKYLLRHEKNHKPLPTGDLDSLKVPANQVDLLKH